MKKSRSYQSRTPRRTGTIFLQTPAQVALWEHELTGQISDGCWENSRPHGHYEFWCRLEKKLDPQGAPRVETGCGYAVLKRSYGFSKLYFYDEETQTRPVQDRMVKLGRLATVYAELGLGELTYEQRITAEYMPATLEAFRAGSFGYGAPGSAQELEFAARAHAAVPDAAAVAYYSALGRYGLRQMKSDVKVIAGAMKNMVPVPAA